MPYSRNRPVEREWILPSRSGDRFDRNTVDSDAQSYYSHSNASSDSLSPADWLMDKPVFTLGKDEDASKPVYEAWGLRLPAAIEDDEMREVKLSPAEGEQHELAMMHLHALEDFHHSGSPPRRGRRRGFAWAPRLPRVLRGAQRYDEYLDEKCRKLPLVIQEAIYDLLETRGARSSTRWRTRTWTVVVMQERERYRFAEKELSETKRHRFRFWKNKNPQSAEMHDYFVIIRGEETKASRNPKGITEFWREGNPWMHVDRMECRRKAQDAHMERVRRYQEHRRCRSPPRYSRSVSQDRSTPRRTVWRDYSPMSDQETDRSRYQSPPSYRSRRDHSPISEPDTEAQARSYIHMTRASARRPPVPAPPHPEPLEPMVYPEPPLPPVFGYGADSSPRQQLIHPSPMTAPPPPFPNNGLSWNPRVCVWGADVQTLEPVPSTYTRPEVTVFTPQHFGIPEDSIAYPSVHDNTPPCLACGVTPECAHFPRGTDCERPINSHGDVVTHPPCFICMAKAPDTMGPREFHPLWPPMPPQAPMPPPKEVASSFPPVTSRWSDSLPDNCEDATDIEDDDDDDDDGVSDDGETTAVGGDSPLPKEDGI